MTEQIEMPEDSLAPRGAGPQLRLAREHKGLSIKDLAERTRIPQRQIEKIEAGNFAAYFRDLDGNKLCAIAMGPE
jgi:transcriptional regulator with XRE-family HTH domain